MRAVGRHHRAHATRSFGRPAPSRPSPTSRASIGTRSPAGKHAGLLAGPLRGRPGRLGARRPRAGARGLARQGGDFPSRDGDRRRIAVPGAGRGHDARLLARRGYRVWGFDWAPSAIAEATRLAAADGVDVAFEARDVFTLADHTAASSTACGSTRASARSTPRGAQSTCACSARPPAAGRPAPRLLLPTPRRNRRPPLPGFSRERRSRAVLRRPGVQRCRAA